MAAGNYQVDLTVINLAETNTGWNDINQAGGGGANTAEVDFAIQGTNAITRQVSNTRRGVLYDFGSPVTLGADDHIYTWTVCSTPGIVDNKSLGGIRVSVGTSTTAYYDFYTNGGDTLPEGGMNNYVVYYAAASASLTNGSPGANPQFFGAQASTNATARNVNFACDAIRYGTGYYIFDGDSTNPITFASASQDNDLNANRYGVFTAIPGGFSQKGRFVIGQTTASAATQAYFSDANTTVQFADTEFAQADFTQIIVDHPSTFANFRNITFVGLGTKNPGQFNFLDNSTVGYLDGCTFNSIGTTQLQAAVTASSTWLGCSTVNQSGSLINASNFTNTNAPVSALVSDRPDRVTNCTFTSTGTKHGIEVTAAGNYVFTGNTLTGFDSGSNANEFLYFNPTGGTGNLTLTVVSGNGTIEYRNASSGTVTIVNSVTVTLTGLKDNTEVRIFEGTNSYPQTELAGIEDATDGTTDDRSFSFSLEVGTVVDIVIHNKNYRYLRIEDFELTETQDLPITQIFDRSYDNVGGETVYLSDPYFTSLAARSTYYENETESKAFAQSLESQGLWESASLVYVPAGYSDDGVLHTLVPSSSTGDLKNSLSASATSVKNYEFLSTINEEGFIISGSRGRPRLTYDFQSIGKSGSLFMSDQFFDDIQYPIEFVDNPDGNYMFATDRLTSSSNSISTFPAAGVISPQGTENVTELKDDNSGGSKEVYFEYPNATLVTGNFSTSFFVSSSGANWFYISASNYASSSAIWFDLINETTGSYTSNYVGSSNPPLWDIQKFKNNWLRVSLYHAMPSTDTLGDLRWGIADADNTKTITADGTANVYIWGLHNARSLTSLKSQRPFVFNDGTTNILISANTYSSSIAFPEPLRSGSIYAEVSPDLGYGLPTDIDLNYLQVNIAQGTSVRLLSDDGSRYINLTGQYIGANTPTYERAQIIIASPSAFNNTTTLTVAENTAKIGNFIKLACKFEDNDVGYFVSGSKVYTSTVASNIFPDPLTKIRFTGIGRIKNVVVFNKPLSDAELIALTS